MANSDSVPNVVNTKMPRNFSTGHSSEESAEFALAARDETGDQLLLPSQGCERYKRQHLFSVLSVTPEWCCVAGNMVSSTVAQGFQNVEEQENTGKGAQLHITRPTTLLHHLIENSCCRSIVPLLVLVENIIYSSRHNGVVGRNVSSHLL